MNCIVLAGVSVGDSDVAEIHVLCDDGWVAIVKSRDSRNIIIFDQVDCKVDDFASEECRFCDRIG